MKSEIIWGILIPFAGTVFGAASVFFMGRGRKIVLQRALTGFAAGVMAAASVWSLLVPAMERSEAMGRWAFVPAAAGFWAGILFLLFLDRTVPHLHMDGGREGAAGNLARTTMLVLAVALHNLPEGMAVGVVYAGRLSGEAGISAAGAMALSLGKARSFPCPCGRRAPGGDGRFGMECFPGR